MNRDFVNLQLPFDKEVLLRLKAGDRCMLSGILYTARDAAHKRLTDAIVAGNEIPVDIKGQTIYYVGPCVKDGKVLSAGPTTSMRMDKYAPTLYEIGLVATIGKGDRSEQVYAAIKMAKGVYFAAIGGAGALYADAIISSEVVAYEDLGTEAIRRLEVKDFPVIVAIDSEGNGIFPRC